MTPGDRMAQLYPRHWVPILVAFYDMHGLQWPSHVKLVILLWQFKERTLYALRYKYDFLVGKLQIMK
jgi:hypothetical protein